MGYTKKREKTPSVFKFQAEGKIGYRIENLFSCFNPSRCYTKELIFLGLSSLFFESFPDLEERWLLNFAMPNGRSTASAPAG